MASDEQEADGVAVVVTHHATTGPSDALEAYLRERRRRVVVIEHGFGDAVAVGTTIRVWESGRLAWERRFPWHTAIPGPMTWLKDFALSLTVPLWSRGRSDEYIGIDSLNAAAGLTLQWLGFVRRTCFWTIDYAPDRFGNAFLNRVYFALDRLCVERCSETWNLSPRMAEARGARGVYGSQRVVPMGANVHSTVLASDPHRLVHMGSLLEKQGVQMVLRALPLVRREVPDANLLIIGGGPYQASLQRLAGVLGIADAVEFAGYVEDHAEVERLISESAVALATYDPSLAGFTYYADPGKIKTYLGAGVPVVVTDVPWSARWLVKEGAGVLVEYEAADVARGIVRLFGDGDARAAAVRLGASTDWTGIFDDGFERATT